MAWSSGFSKFARSRKGKVGLVSVKKTRHIPGTMNKAEDAFAKELDVRIAAGTVIKWEFENWTLRLSDDCRYTPDFRCVVREADGAKVIVFFEVKAQRKSKRTNKETGVVMESRKPFWEDDAKVKIRVAAREYPEYRWVGVSKNLDGTWREDVFANGEDE